MSLPVLDTERLRLRRFTEADHADALAIYGDPEVTRGLGGMEPVVGMDGIRAHLARIAERVRRYPAGQGGWAVALRDTDRVIGGALLKPLPDGDDNATEDIEIGWHLARSCWGHGYATEAGRAVLAYGFDVLGLDVIWATVLPWNEASFAVARRLGMRAEGKTEAYYGQETELFSLRRADWSRR